jgi:hypothetical protein
MHQGDCDREKVQRLYDQTDQHFTAQHNALVQQRKEQARAELQSEIYNPEGTPGLSAKIESLNGRPLPDDLRAIEYDD